MYMPPNTRLKLDPQDEFTHPPEAVGSYNESTTEYHCGEHRVLGMAEYCDVMEDGVPLSVREEATA
jgi:hypothetical protein